MLGILVFMSHVMPAMFCCALPRYVFIKKVDGGFLDQLTEDLTGNGKTDDEYIEVVEEVGSIRTDFSNSTVNDEEYLKANDTVEEKPEAGETTLKRLATFD
jgi:hypothetical protein